MRPIYVENTNADLLVDNNVTAENLPIVRTIYGYHSFWSFNKDELALVAAGFPIKISIFKDSTMTVEVDTL